MRSPTASTWSSWSREPSGPARGRWAGRRPEVRVLELWRYPVKSLQGERLETAEIGAEGIAGDRQWAVLDVRDPIPRCVMVTRPQPGGIARDTSVLKRIHRELDGELAIGAVVRGGGAVRVGDALVP